jgi:hypothetical protein
VGSIISLVASAVVGAALAVFAVLGITSAATKAPSTNPANAQVVNYGAR